ncbi:MAG TPA: radical SAM protein [Kiritimatiellia bacterium]|nr:radical SAM protein [Kiritimatiellia bacterium]HRZ11484.1 radical SAM protein [Kiritimatiellia bacterium]HSA16965.1 radical SAM protein [Kiritimatiellia bacterium]
MKIMLVNPIIRPDQPPGDFPVGLGIIAEIMRREGHDVRVYDENALRPDRETFQRDLAAMDEPDVVGVGGLITIYGHLKGLLPALKDRFPRATLVLGGGVTIEPDVIFENMPVDYCVHGEGEHTFRELCAALDASAAKDLPGIKGISFRDRVNGGLVVTPPRPIERNLDLFPMPAYDLFPAETYFRNNRGEVAFWSKNADVQRCATLVWSRGCPNECSFCWRMMGRTVRFRSMDKVMEEIAHLRSRYGVDSYLFVDECINAARVKSVEFAERLVREGYAAPWYSHARADRFDPELAALFRRSGCVGLNFGIESGNEIILATMKKRASPEKAAAAIAIAREAGIGAQCTFIIGTPGESRATVRDSVRWIRKNKVRHFYFFYFTPYPGCEEYHRPETQERIRRRYGSKDAYFSVLGDAYKLVVNLTGVSDARLTKWREWAFRAARESAWERGKRRVASLASLAGKALKLLVQPSRWRAALGNRLRRGGWYEFRSP